MNSTTLSFVLTGILLLNHSKEFSSATRYTSKEAGMNNISQSRLLIHPTNHVLQNDGSDYCDNYGLCGPNGMCVISASRVCNCLKGFKPRSPDDWNLTEYSQGCVRDKPLSCLRNSGHGFIKYVGLKLPDIKYSSKLSR